MYCIASASAGLVLAQVDPLGGRPLAGDAELDAEEAAGRGRRDVDVDDAVAHLEVLDHGGAAVEEEALASLVLDHLGFPSSSQRGESGGSASGTGAPAAAADREKSMKSAQTTMDRRMTCLTGR